MIETWKNDFRAFVNSLNLSRDDYKTMMEYIDEIPAVQPDHTADVSKKVSISCAHENDLIYREAAIEALARMMPRSYTPDGSHPADEEIFRAQEIFADCIEALEILPSAQSERTCVNCGRTANNGGWYADGRTRCPIEEHYALPKDGYCHLWEKRNVTDDNYPGRREE